MIVLLGGLVVLAWLGIPVLIVALVVRAGQAGAKASPAPGAPVRRLFQYGLMFVALLLAGFGLEGLVRAAVESGSTIAGAPNVAGPLAMVLVAVPALLGLLAWTRRHMEADPGEPSSTGWLLYGTFGTLFALGAVSVGVAFTIASILGDAPGLPTPWVGALVWAGIWLGHWLLMQRWVPADEGRSHLLMGSLWGMWGAIASGAAIAGLLLAEAYQQVLGDVITSHAWDTVKVLIGPLVVSVGVWWWYWQQHGRRAATTLGWHAYVLLGGVLVGLLALIGAAGTVLFTVLGWFIDRPAVGGADHFMPVPYAIGVGLVGWLAWMHHRQLVRADQPDEVGRAYNYLLAAVGLVAMAAGAATLVVAMIEAFVAPPLLVGGGESTLALWGLTLVMVGLPVWWVAWSSEGAGGHAGEASRSSFSRRLYLTLSFGLGGLVALAALIGLLTIFAADLMGDGAGSHTLYGIRWQLALILVVGAVAGYHWRVFRGDRAAEAPAESPRLTSILLVASGDASSLGRELAAATGADVDVWQADGDDGSANLDDVLSALGDVEGSEVIVSVGDGVVTVTTGRRLGR